MLKETMNKKCARYIVIFLEIVIPFSETQNDVLYYIVFYILWVLGCFYSLST